MSRKQVDDFGTVPFFLAGGNPNWVPRVPLMGLKRFEVKDVESQAPRSRRGRRAVAVTAPALTEDDSNDFE